MAEMAEAARIQRETEERVAAAVLTQGYIADLLPSVLEGLKEAGYFIDDIRQGVWYSGLWEIALDIHWA